MNIFDLRTCVERRNKRTSKWTNYSTRRNSDPTGERERDEKKNIELVNWAVLRFSIFIFLASIWHLLFRGACFVLIRESVHCRCGDEISANCTQYVLRVLRVSMPRVNVATQVTQLHIALHITSFWLLPKNFNLIRFVQSHYISDIERVISVYPIFHSII